MIDPRLLLDRVRVLYFQPSSRSHELNRTQKRIFKEFVARVDSIPKRVVAVANRHAFNGQAFCCCCRCERPKNVSVNFALCHRHRHHHHHRYAPFIDDVCTRRASHAVHLVPVFAGAGVAAKVRNPPKPSQRSRTPHAFDALMTLVYSSKHAGSMRDNDVIVSHTCAQRRHAQLGISNACCIQLAFGIQCAPSERG